MARLRTVINGFGRIGRLILRGNLVKNTVDIVAINDPNPVESLTYLLKYDSAHGVLKADVKVIDGNIAVNGTVIPCYAEKEPIKLPWKALNVDLVFEASGIFTERAQAAQHLDAGAKRVMITAPAKGADATFVMGVNHEMFDPTKHTVFSNASCTTNCLAPMSKVIHENFGIVKAFMTTIHAYTNDQRTLDLPHKDPRRGRTAAVNTIPTSTGAAYAIGEVIPELKGKMDGIAIRVPVTDGSITDLVCIIEKKATKEDINSAFKKASEGPMKGIIQYTEDPIVSSDVVGNDYSCVFDSKLTNVIGDNFIKVFGWYDNEWAYSLRLLDLAAYIASKL